MRRVQKLDRSKRWVELSLVVVDHRVMRELHAQYFGTSKQTDVMSFAYPPAPGDDGHTGEVIVNAERATEYGPYFKGINEEFALYLAHGCHHLSGADDQALAERVAMRRVEERWLDEAHAEYLIEPIQLRKF